MGVNDLVNLSGKEVHKGINITSRIKSCGFKRKFLRKEGVLNERQRDSINLCGMCTDSTNCI
jgi:hypothetical protein